MCGSFCAPSCGVCIRDDRMGPATCFAFRHGYDTAAILGACGASPDAASVRDSAVETDAEADGEALSSANAGPCSLLLPVCRESPPIVDAAQVDGSVEDAADQADDAGSGDASDAASRIDGSSDAAPEAGDGGS
jgi:hypothetical protein